jgi:hypothetical protein
MKDEFEVRWSNGRAYFVTRRRAIAFALTLGDKSVRVIHWGQGAIVWERV